MFSLFVEKKLPQQLGHTKTICLSGSGSGNLIVLGVHYVGSVNWWKATSSHRGCIEILRWPHRRLNTLFVSICLCFLLFSQVFDPLLPANQPNHINSDPAITVSYSAETSSYNSYNSVLHILFYDD